MPTAKAMTASRAMGFALFHDRHACEMTDHTAEILACPGL
jgi:hypothetical protein